jgi:hypothetical protein
LFKRKELKMAQNKPGPNVGRRLEVKVDPDEVVVDKILENLVIAMEGHGLPRATIVRGMIGTWLGLMISERGYDGAGKELRDYADAMDILAIRGTA